MTPSIPIREKTLRLWVAAHRWPLAVSWLVIGVVIQLVAR